MASGRISGVILGVLFLSFSASAQLEGWEQTFKDTRVINGHSVETNQRGGMKFIISHRFGPVNRGLYDLFGFDQSTIRIGLDYGITDRFTVGAGRSSMGKHYDGFAKYRFLVQQTDGAPLSVTGMSNITVNTLRWADPDRENFFTSRLYYTFQVLLARKFSDDFSLQLMPTLVHRNLVPTAEIAHDVLSLGASARFQITKHMAIQAEGFFVPDGQLADNFTHPVSIGIDIETKGHQFQLSLSNALGMTEKIFITETVQDITEGAVGLGFNITRDFRMRGRK